MATAKFQITYFTIRYSDGHFESAVGAFYRRFSVGANTVYDWFSNWDTTTTLRLNNFINSNY